MKFPEIIIDQLKQHDLLYLPMGSTWVVGIAVSCDKIPIFNLCFRVERTKKFIVENIQVAYIVYSDP